MTTRLPTPHVQDTASIEAVTGPRGIESHLMDFRTIFVTLWRNRLMIGFSGVLTAVVAALFLAQADSVYTARTQILLDTRARQVINIENIVDDAVYSEGAVLSEISLVQSNTLLREVVDRLRLVEHPDFNPTLQETSALSNVISAVMDSIRSLFASGSGEKVDRSPEQIAANILAQKVVVEQVGMSFILQVTASSTNRSLAADIANTLAQVYLDRQVDIKLDENARATEWLSLRESELRTMTEDTERRLTAKRAALTATGRLSTTTIEGQIGQLTGEMVRAQVEAAENAARAQRFDSLVSTGDLTAATLIVSSPRLLQLIDRRGSILQQREAISGSTAIGVAQAQLVASLAQVETAIAAETRELSTGLHALAAIAEQKRGNLETRLAGLEYDTYEQSGEMIDMRTLERDLAATQAVYAQFLNRLTEARQRGNFQQADARMVSPAEPPQQPSSPQRTMLTLLALIFGVSITASITLVAAARREVYRTPREAEAGIGLPVLAVLGAEDEGRVGRWLRQAPETAYAIRRLATLTGCSGGDGRGARVIMVTSSLPDEGSVGLCIHLATTCAARSIGVIVLDCDPSHQSELHALAPDAVPIQTVSELNFDVCRIDSADSVAHGQPPSATLSSVLDTLRQSYSLVIVSAPPVLASPEALEMSREVDRTIVTFVWERTPTGVLREALDNLRRSNVTVEGLVMTRANTKVMALYEHWGAPAARNKIARYIRGGTCQQL